MLAISKVAAGGRKMAPRLTVGGHPAHARRLVGEALQQPSPFRELYDEHFTYVCNSLRRLGVGAQDLEDLIQDVFEAVFNKLTSYDRARPIRPWLFGIALCVVLDHRKRGRRWWRVVGAKAISARAEMVDPAPLPDHATELHRRSELVTGALESLELNRRTVFVMADLGGHSMPEIAEALAVPLNTAYSRLRLARRDFEAAVRRLQSARAHGAEPQPLTACRGS
jgi:RNA polymerase sigma-70 factor (ECF subfamily)